MNALNRICCWMICLGVAHGAAFAQAKGPGGGNGGNGSQSRPELVAEAVNELRRSLHDVTNRMRTFIRSEFTEDRNRVNDGDVVRFLNNPSLDATIDKMTIDPRNGDCISNDPKHLDGSANKNSQSICISVSRMVRYSKSSVKFEVLGLGVHEVAHLLGASEFEAQGIQDWILDHDRITSLDSEQTYRILSSYTNAASSLRDMLTALEFPDQYMRFCRDAIELHERLDRAHSESQFLPQVLWIEDFILKVKVPAIEWTQNVCGAEKYSPFSQAQRGQLTAQIKSMNEILKAQAYRVLDYDSTNRRLEYMFKYVWK